MPAPTFRKWLGIELIEIGWGERLIAALGGGVAIAVLLGVTGWVLPGVEGWAVLASMGASAVLLFAVPHGPMSQPWPVLVGHGLSALIGVACARWFGDPLLAAGCAVGLSIGGMQVLKCIHPPGGATALTAVVGGKAIHDLGFHFVLVPVLANAVTMVVLAVAVNWFFRWRRYPAAFNRQALPEAAASELSTAPTHEQVVAAVRSLDSFVDISEEDLLRVVNALCPAANEDDPCGRA
jgi:CBS domain-containing membrane protein